MAKTKKAVKTVKGYKITVRGQYRSRSEAGVSIKFFEPLTFTLPEFSEYKNGQKWKKHKTPDGIEKRISVPNIVRQNTINCANHMIQRYYLIPVLKEKYPDFVSLRTCEIIEKKKVKVDGDLARSITKMPIEDMNESQLLLFVAMHDIIVTMDIYPDLGDKRIAVKFAYEDQLKSSQEAFDQEEDFDPLLSEPKGFSGDFEEEDDLLEDLI